MPPTKQELARIKVVALKESVIQYRNAGQVDLLVARFGQLSVADEYREGWLVSARCC